MTAGCKFVRLYALFPGEAAALSEPGIVLLAVVGRLRMILLARFDFVQQRHGLLEQRPAEFQSSLVHLDHFVAFRIDGILHLAHDWTIVDSGSDLVDGDTVLV